TERRRGNQGQDRQCSDDGGHCAVGRNPRQAFHDMTFLSPGYPRTTVRTVDDCLSAVEKRIRPPVGARSAYAGPHHADTTRTAWPIAVGCHLGPGRADASEWWRISRGRAPRPSGRSNECDPGEQGREVAVLVARVLDTLSERLRQRRDVPDPDDVEATVA